MPEFYLTLPSGHTVSYREIKAKNVSSETVVILGGLADDATVWLPLLPHFNFSRTRLILVNLIGQGSALERDFEKGMSSFRVSIADQAEGLKLIFDQIGLDAAVHLVGFSYGGAVALEFQKRNPFCIKQIHLWLPFVARLDVSNPFMKIWTQNMSSILSLNPVSKIWLKKWQATYHEWLSHYMHYRFSKRVPDHRHRQVVVEISQGALGFDGFRIIQSLKNCRTHLVISHMDTLVPLTLYDEIWSQIPSSQKGYCLRVRDGEHLLHEQSPQLLAKWLEFCLTHGELLGREFDGFAASGEIKTEHLSSYPLKWA